MNNLTDWVYHGKVMVNSNFEQSTSTELRGKFAVAWAPDRNKFVSDDL